MFPLPHVAAGLRGLQLPLVLHVLQPLPPPPPQLHPRITDALDCGQYQPSAQILSLLGRRAIHVVVSRCKHPIPPGIAQLTVLCRPWRVHCHTSPLSHSQLRVDGVHAFVERVARQVRGILLGNMATLGLGGVDAMVVVAGTELHGVLACARVVVFGSAKVAVACGLMTRVLGTRAVGCEVTDTLTHMAEVQRMLVVSGPVEGVLGVCSRLPDGVVLVVVPGEMLQVLADLYVGVWLVDGMPQGGVRMLLVGL